MLACRKSRQGKKEKHNILPVISGAKPLIKKAELACGRVFDNSTNQMEVKKRC